MFPMRKMTIQSLPALVVNSSEALLLSNWFYSQGYGAYPPPPEPAPDFPSSRAKKAPALPSSGRLPVQRTFTDGIVIYLLFSQYFSFLLCHSFQC